jgi:hypothetical protein
MTNFIVINSRIVSIVLVGMMELVLDATSMVAFNARQVTI